MALLQGIDVSDAGQGLSVDWQDVAHTGGITFAYMKCSQGTYFRDPAFARNWALSGEAGIIRGAYHYWDATVDPVKQAQFFYNLYGKWQSGDLPPAIDVEDEKWLYPSRGATMSPQELSDHLYATAQEIDSLCGADSVFYTYGYLWKVRLGNTTRFSNRRLWLADYTPPEDMIGGWQSSVIQQYSDKGYVGSKRLYVDLDEWQGDLASLQAFCRPTVPGVYTPPGARFSLIGGFRDYYLRDSNPMQHFGLPITGEIQERLSDGNTYTVQYFERARFEWHVESGTGVVLLGLVGAEDAHARGIQI